MTLAVLLARAEPRRLAPGLIGVPAIALAGLSVLGAFLARAQSDDERWAWVILGILGVIVLLVALLGLFLLINAWTVIRRERLGAAALASGGLGLAMLAYIVLCFVALYGNQVQLAFWLLCLGLPAGYLGYVFAAYLLYGSIYGFWMRRRAFPVDAVVVLGSGLGGGERVTPLLAARLDLGRAIYERSREAGHSTILITSGGKGPDEKLPEAEAMERYLIDAGVREADVLQEDRSTDTRENLTFSKELAQRHDVTGQVAVATNNYHAFRAALLMRAAGIPGYTVGAPVAFYYWPSATVREFIAILRDNLKLNAVILGVLCLPLLIMAATIPLRVAGG